MRIIAKRNKRIWGVGSHCVMTDDKEYRVYRYIQPGTTSFGGAWELLKTFDNKPDAMKLLNAEANRYRKRFNL